jgi:hypothetical protein
MKLEKTEKKHDSKLKLKKIKKHDWKLKLGSKFFYVNLCMQWLSFVTIYTLRQLTYWI